MLIESLYEFSSLLWRLSQLSDIIENAFPFQAAARPERLPSSSAARSSAKALVLARRPITEAHEGDRPPERFREQSPATTAPAHQACPEQA